MRRFALLATAAAMTAASAAAVPAFAQTTVVSRAMPVTGNTPEVCALQRATLAQGSQVNFRALTGNLLQIDVGDEVDLHRARERIGDHQRRRGEVVGPDVGVDAALEIAVAGEDGSGDEVALLDRRGDWRRQWA